MGESHSSPGETKSEGAGLQVEIGPFVALLLRVTTPASSASFAPRVYGGVIRSPDLIPLISVTSTAPPLCPIPNSFSALLGSM